MKTTTQHTPTPWKWTGESKLGAFLLVGSDNMKIARNAVVGGSAIDIRTDISNMEFIVKAVNSHEDMLDVIKRAKRVVAESCGYNDGVRFHTDLLRDIESAIAQAEGK